MIYEKGGKLELYNVENFRRYIPINCSSFSSKWIFLFVSKKLHAYIESVVID
jgi:hypothetical protein